MDERIKNIKIAVHNEEESRKVQERLFYFGARIVPLNSGFLPLNSGYLFVDSNMFIAFSANNKKRFDEHPNNEIYIEDLLAMKVEKEPKELDLIGILKSRDDLGEFNLKNITQDVLNKKQKILEDFQKRSDDKARNPANRHCSLGTSEIEEILDKRIGLDTRPTGEEK